MLIAISALLFYANQAYGVVIIYTKRTLHKTTSNCVQENSASEEIKSNNAIITLGTNLINLNNTSQWKRPANTIFTMLAPGVDEDFCNSVIVNCSTMT